MVRERRGRGSPVWLFGLAVLLGFDVLAPGAARAQEELVRLDDRRAISNAGIYIAIEKGYFREAGIRNELIEFASAAKVVPALTAGEMEVSAGTPSAGLFNAIAQGAPFRIVADKGQVRADTGYSMLMVRKDLVESGQVKSVRDLKGRKVALFAKGITQDYTLGKMAEEVGLTIKDFDLTTLGAPSQLTAFQTKAIDAAVTVEPWGARFQDRGVAVKFRTPDQVKGLAPMQVAVIIYSGKFIKEKRAVAQRWMDAYLKGCQVYVEKGPHNPEVLAILEKHTKIPASTIKVAVPHHQDPKGRLILESLADMITWFVANGFMPQPISVDQAVDLSFLK
jgi:NitT/TauT family transport system substrate-binding protein